MSNPAVEGRFDVICRLKSFKEDIDALKELVASLPDVNERLLRIENDVAILESKKSVPIIPKEPEPVPDNISTETETTAIAASNSADVVMDYVNDQIESIKNQLLAENNSVNERLTRLETDLAFVESETSSLLNKQEVAQRTVVSIDDMARVRLVLQVLHETILSRDKNYTINLNGRVLVSLHEDADSVVINVNI